MSWGVFPFGQKVKILRQEDTSPKRVFVLGVYASAVHARWTDSRGKQRIPAFAVASEPYIFWTGENAQDLLAPIRIPSAVGTLSPAAEMHNGSSGRSLDERFLRPLGLTRKDVWLCDLYPFTMLNDRQLEAIRRKYTPLASRHNLPRPSLEKAPKQSPGQRRIQEILAEIRESGAHPHSSRRLSHRLVLMRPFAGQAAPLRLWAGRPPSTANFTRWKSRALLSTCSPWSIHGKPPASAALPLGGATFTTIGLRL
jgi:hypothetical protein